MSSCELIVLVQDNFEQVPQGIHQSNNLFHKELLYINLQRYFVKMGHILSGVQLAASLTFLD